VGDDWLLLTSYFPLVCLIYPRGLDEALPCQIIPTTAIIMPRTTCRLRPSFPKKKNPMISTRIVFIWPSTWKDTTVSPSASKNNPIHVTMTSQQHAPRSSSRRVKRRDVIMEERRALWRVKWGAFEAICSYSVFTLLCFESYGTVFYLFKRVLKIPRERGGIMCGCCGLEFSSWSVWLAAGKRECRGALVGWKEKEEGFLGRRLLFLSLEGGQPTLVSKGRALGFFVV